MKVNIGEKLRIRVWYCSIQVLFWISTYVIIYREILDVPNSAAITGSITLQPPSQIPSRPPNELTVGAYPFLLASVNFSTTELNPKSLPM